MKKQDEELLIYKWRYYFKAVMDSIGASRITPDSLINLALVNPSSSALCNSMEEGLLFANKAIESIKNDEDMFLKYNNKDNAIEFKPV